MSDPKTSPVESLRSITVRFLIATESALVMGVGGAAVANLYTLPQIGSERILLIGVTLPSLMATGLFLATLIIFSDLMPSGRLSFPNQWTFPIVFTVLTLVSMTLLSGTPRGLQRPPDILLISRVWLQPVLIGLAFTINYVGIQTLISIHDAFAKPGKPQRGNV